MKTRKILSLLLAALLVCGALTACSGNAADGSQTQNDGSVQNAPQSGSEPAPDAEEAAPAEEPDPGLLDELPTDVKYDGDTFTVLSHEHGASAVAWMVQDIWTEGENGERINDAVFQRNLLM